MFRRHTIRGTLVTRCSLQYPAHWSLQCSLCCSCHQAWGRRRSMQKHRLWYQPLLLIFLCSFNIQYAGTIILYLLNSISPLPEAGSFFMYVSHHSMIAGTYSFSISMAATSDMPRQYLYICSGRIKETQSWVKFLNAYRSFSDSRVEVTPLISSMMAAFKATPLNDTPTSCRLSSTRWNTSCSILPIIIASLASERPLNFSAKTALKEEKRYEN